MRRPQTGACLFALFALEWGLFARLASLRINLPMGKRAALGRCSKIPFPTPAETGSMTGWRVPSLCPPPLSPSRRDRDSGRPYCDRLVELLGIDLCRACRLRCGGCRFTQYDSLYRKQRTYRLARQIAKDPRCPLRLLFGHLPLPNLRLVSALFGPHAMPDLSPECAQEQTSCGACSTAVIAISGRRRDADRRDLPPPAGAGGSRGVGARRFPCILMSIADRTMALRGLRTAQN
jgi:hypothetical protein